MVKQGTEFAFKGWKIWLIVLFGLGISAYMLGRSLNDSQFVEVAQGQGTHVWQDANGNQKVDFELQEEFKKHAHGNFQLQENWIILKNLDWTSQHLFWIILAIFCMFGRDLAYMWRIRVLTNKQLSWKKSFRVIMLWEFASAVSPGVVGGSAMAMFILKKEQISLGRSTAIVLITALMDNLFFVLLIPLVLLFVSFDPLFPAESWQGQSLQWLFWLAYSIILTICTLLAISIFIYPQLLKNILGSVFRIPFLRKWRAKAEQVGADIVASSRLLRQEKWTFWFQSFFATILSWTSRYLVINCLMAAFVSLSFGQHVLILGKQLILWVLMLVSPSPGASGVAELAFGEIMQGLGASVLFISLVVILWRLLSYFPYLLIGSLILPKWLARKAPPSQQIADQNQ